MICITTNGLLCIVITRVCMFSICIYVIHSVLPHGSDAYELIFRQKRRVATSLKVSVEVMLPEQ
jgi:hypothetical protein